MRVLISSKVLYSSLMQWVPLYKNEDGGVSDIDKSKITLTKNQLRIWNTDMAITRGRNDNGKDCESWVENSSIRTLIKVLHHLQEQPVVLVFSHDTSYLSLDSIDL